MKKRALRVGFLALTDAAPLAVAQQKGLFGRYRLNVELHREASWAAIREKITLGVLDAAHTPAPMLWSTRLGLAGQPCPVLTAFILSLNGNALTLSEQLWERGVRDAACFRLEVQKRRKKLVFAVSSGFSTHHLFLRSWLRSIGVDPDADVQVVNIPPDQMFRSLGNGSIDGYCTGEPWNSLAVRERIGWCPTWSAADTPGHDAKVLMVTEAFAESRAKEHAALISALAESCAWCEDVANREGLGNLLADSAYINQTARIIFPGLAGRFDPGHSMTPVAPEFQVFHRWQANCPTRERGEAIQHDLISSGLIHPGAVAPDLATRLFREDLFRQALGLEPTAALLSS